MVKKSSLAALLFRETEEGTVVFQEFADEKEGINRNDAIAYQTCNVIGLGVFIPFEKHLIPKFLNFTILNKLR